MEDRIRIFLNNYINGLYFPTVHLTDVIEILIITVIFCGFGGGVPGLGDEKYGGDGVHLLSVVESL